MEITPVNLIIPAADTNETESVMFSLPYTCESDEYLIRRVLFLKLYCYICSKAQNPPA